MDQADRSFPGSTGNSQPSARIADPALLAIDGVTAGLPSRPFGTIPVLPALEGLLPGRGLARGTVLSVSDPGMLCQALLAGASQAGAWCGIAGLPQFGVVAAAEAGADPQRMILVPEPGDRWADVAVELLGISEVVLIGSPGRVASPAWRRVETELRASDAALVVAGPWEGAALRMRVVHRQWEGIGDGCGRLRACRAQVVAAGRGPAARERCCWLWLPGPDGVIAAVPPAPGRTRSETIAAGTG